MGSFFVGNRQIRRGRSQRIINAGLYPNQNVSFHETAPPSRRTANAAGGACFGLLSYADLHHVGNGFDVAIAGLITMWRSKVRKLDRISWRLTEQMGSGHKKRLFLFIEEESFTKVCMLRQFDGGALTDRRFISSFFLSRRGRLCGGGSRRRGCGVSGAGGCAGGPRGCRGRRRRRGGWR